jgi:hypothetical protein
MTIFIQALLYFDIFAKNFNFFVFGNEKQKTVLGCLIGIFSILAITIISLFFLVDFFKRENVTVMYNKDIDTKPVINLTYMPLMFSLSDLQTNFIDPQGLFTFDVRMLNYVKVYNKTSGQTSTRLTSQQIEYERCNISKHFLNYQEMFKNFKTESFFCIPPGRYNLTLFGKYGDFLNGFSMLSIFVNRCNPQKSQCFNSSIIESKLSNVILPLVYLSYGINNYNSTQANFPKLETSVLGMTTALYKLHFYNLKQTFYHSDLGYVFQENIIENFYEFDQTTMSIDLLNAGQISQGTFGTVYIRNSDHISVYKRQYKKLQDVLANIGGLVNSILLISRLLSNFIIRKFVWVDLFKYFSLKESSDPVSLSNIKHESINHSDIKFLNLQTNIKQLPNIPGRKLFFSRK